MTAIPLTQLFWRHSVGLKLLVFKNYLVVGSLFLINIQRKNLLQTEVGVHTRHSPYAKDGVTPERKQLEKCNRVVQ